MQKEAIKLNDDLVSKIKSLRPSGTKSELKKLLPEIDLKIREGVSHEDIVATLYSAGIDININTFRSALYRYRKETRESDPNPS
jgi:hypothetical protein